MFAAAAFHKLGYLRVFEISTVWYKKASPRNVGSRFSFYSFIFLPFCLLLPLHIYTCCCLYLLSVCNEDIGYGYGYGFGLFYYSFVFFFVFYRDDLVRFFDVDVKVRPFWRHPVEFTYVIFRYVTHVLAKLQ